MCANYKIISKHQALLLGLPEPTFDYKVEAYPMDMCPILIASQQPIEWRQAMFGLVPNWSKDIKFARHTYNARSETVASKPSFRHAWANNQFCLIPMQAFYEPKYINDISMTKINTTESSNTNKSKAHRYQIEQVNQAPFTVAGLWDMRKDTATGEWLRSFTMLTVNADNNPFMRQFHKPNDEKRSIVIISPQQRQEWLTTSHQQAQDFLIDAINQPSTNRPFTHNDLHIDNAHSNESKTYFITSAAPRPNKTSAAISANHLLPDAQLKTNKLLNNNQYRLFDE